MTNLISGKEALIALANGEEVESRHRDLDKVWNNAKSLTLVESFLNPATPRDFRLKPRTITINGIEVPAPFEPKEGDCVWFISDDCDCGYCSVNWLKSHSVVMGTWRTKDEIKQVVEALRQVFGKEMKDD